MLNSVASDESLREGCARHQPERHTAYSDIYHLKDANAQLIATVRDLEVTVARLRRERTDAEDKLTELLEHVRKGKPAGLQNGRQETHRERRHSRNLG